MSFEFAVVIKTTIVLAFAGLASMFLKGASASTRHAVWTIALLCGLLLPMADVLLPQPARMNLPVLHANESEAVIAGSLVSGTVAPTAAAVPPTVRSTPAPINSPPLSQWIATAWALGFTFVLGRLIVATLSARRLVRRSAAISSQTLNSQMNELRNELSIKQPVILRDGGTTPPSTWGLFRHFILLPSDADSWTEEQQRAVFAHKLAHAKRHDGLIQILVQIVCSVYWFNPFIWLAARRMRLERERACDDYALRVGAKAGAYADHLLDLASSENSNATLAAISVAHLSQLEIRLRAILNPKESRDRLSRWAAAFLLSTLAALIFSVAAIHLTSLLSLTLPTSFRVMAAPFAESPQPEPMQQPAVTPILAGTVTGRVLWTDGTPSTRAPVSAIATSTEGLRPDWVMGVKVAGTAVTDSNGRYRIENLPAGLYHIVTGPVYLPRTFSDVTSALVSTSGTHLVTVAAGKTADAMDFTCVRNDKEAIYEAGRVLTITGKLVFASFGGPRTPSVMINNDDGSVSYWQFRGESRSPGNYSTFYWWPGLDAGKGGVLDTMAKAGEIITITGTDTGPGYTGRWQGLHILNTREVTRGGLPQTR